MFANTQMTGQCLGGPDVCITPAAPSPIPVPYPNIAIPTMAIPTVPTILIKGAPVHNFSTTIPMSNGDNAGVLLGVASGLVMGPCRPVVGSFSMLWYNQPSWRMTSVTIQNGTNCPGCTIAPSDTNVTILQP